MSRDGQAGGAGSRGSALGRELSQAHGHIRRMLDEARVALGPVAGVDTIAGGIRVRCRAFVSALRNQQRAEEYLLLPWLRTAYPDLAQVTGRLREDHALIEPLLIDLEHALGSEASWETLASQLDGLEELLENHFRFEKHALDPVLGSPCNERSVGGERFRWL